MRILGKPRRKDNGYPFVGVVQLVKEAKLYSGEKGKFWRATAMTERVPKDERDNGALINMEAGSWLAHRLCEWPAKTSLFVCGEMVKDDYWTSRSGKDCWKLRVMFCLMQPDYNAGEEEEESQAAAYERESAAGGDEWKESASFDCGL